MGPPLQEFLDLLCAGDSPALESYVDGVTPARRTRNGANYLATLLLAIQATGINRVILCCDQLEDFAATTTTRQKRTLETERFRGLCPRASTHERHVDLRCDYAPPRH